MQRIATYKSSNAVRQHATSSLLRSSGNRSSAPIGLHSPKSVDIKASQKVAARGVWVGMLGLHTPDRSLAEVLADAGHREEFVHKQHSPIL
eukprot:3448880-Amphidinium_carterae.1